MNLSYRFTGRAAIASGVIGIAALVSFIGFLVIRDQDAQNGVLPIRVHDSCVILQFLFLIPVVIACYNLIHHQYPNPSRAMRNSGIAALSCIILFLILIFPKIIADTWYMLPQGIFGIWLMIACWRLPEQQAIAY